MPPRLTAVRPAPALVQVGVGAAYFVSGWLGLQFASINASVSPVWPPTGIAVAAIVLFGLRVAPAVTVGAFAFNLLTTHNPWTSLAIALGNTLEGVLGGQAVRRWCSGSDAFVRAPDAARFALLAGLVAPVASATVGVITLLVAGLASADGLGPLWLTWWLGDAAGCLVVAPAVLMVARKPVAERGSRARLAAGLLVVSVLAALAFVTPPGWRGFGWFAVFLAPALAWMAVDLGPRASSLSVLAIALVAEMGTVRGLGILGRGPSNDALLLVQVFLAFGSLTTLILAAGAAQRREGTAAAAGRPPWQSMALAAVGLVPLMATTALAAALFVPQTEALREERFGSYTASVAQSWDEALHRHESRLVGLKGLFESSKDVTRTEYASFIRNTRWLEEEPGVGAVSFVRALPARQVDAFEALRRSDPALDPGVAANFSVHPRTEGTMYVADFVEPLAGNEPALGFNLASESVRLDVLRRAEAARGAQMSAPVELVQGGPGMLLVVPVYGTETDPALAGVTSGSDDASTAPLAGFVVSVYRLDALAAVVAHDLAPLGGPVTFRLTDAGPQPGPDLGAAGSEGVHAAAAITPGSIVLAQAGDVSRRASGLEARVIAIPAFGRAWVLEVAAPPSLLSLSETGSASGTIATGGVLSVAAALTVYAYDSTLRRARHIAARLTSRVDEAEFAMQRGSWERDLGGGGGGVSSWSNGLYRLHGVSRDTFVPTPDNVMALVHPDDRARLRQTLADAAQRQGRFAVEYRIMRPDGRVRILGFEGVVGASADGTPGRMHGLVQDLTDRRAAEQDTQTRRDLLARAEAAAHYGSFEIDAHTGDIQISPGFKALFGLPPDSDKTLQELTGMVVPQDLAAAEDVTRKALANVGRQYLTYGLRRADGEVRGMDVTMQTTAGPDGRPDKVMGIARDITEQKVAEDALKASREQFSRLFHDNPLPMVLVRHEDGIVLDCNQALLELTGHDRMHVQGHPWDRLGIPDLRPVQPSMWTSPLERDVVVRRPDGSTATCVVREATLRVGSQLCSLLVVRDVTRERRSAEVERQSANRLAELTRLQELDRFRTQFINMAAHELRTPILPLRSQLHVLRSQLAADPARRATIEILERNVRRLSRIVEDLLQSSRLQAGRVALHPRPIDLGELVAAEVDAFQATANERGVTLTAHHDADTRVEADSGRIGEIVGNLLSNAVKFTPSGGRIDVSVADAGPQKVEVRVTDTGIGMTAEGLAKLFRPFVQVHDPMQTTEPGSGLGLFICRALAELHGGELTAASPGSHLGSTFVLALPRVLAEPLPAAAGQPFSDDVAVAELGTLGRGVLPRPPRPLRSHARDGAPRKPDVPEVEPGDAQ